MDARRGRGLWVSGTDHRSAAGCRPDWWATRCQILCLKIEDTMNNLRDGPTAMAANSNTCRTLHCPNFLCVRRCCAKVARARCGAHYCTRCSSRCGATQPVHGARVPCFRRAQWSAFRRAPSVAPGFVEYLVCPPGERCSSTSFTRTAFLCGFFTDSGWQFLWDC